VRRGQDIAAEFDGLYLVHQNLPGRRIRKYRRREHLFFVPLQGEIRVATEGDGEGTASALRLGPGRMAYLPPGTLHTFDSSKEHGERLICLIGTERWALTSGGAPIEPAVLPASQLCVELLFYLLLHPETRAGRAIVDVLIQTLAESLEASKNRLSVEHLSGKGRDPRLRSAMAFFERNLGRDVTVGRAAEEAGLSTRTLSRLFLKELGMSPRRALALLRVARAQELLASGRCTVTEAAWEVGYRSLSQFIAVFRQVTGQLPSDFARHGLGDRG